VHVHNWPNNHIFQDDYKKGLIPLKQKISELIIFMHNYPVTMIKLQNISPKY